MPLLLRRLLTDVGRSLLVKLVFIPDHNVGEILSTTIICRQGQILINNVGSGFCRRPCRGFASTPLVCASSRNLACPITYVIDANPVSCSSSETSHLQEVDSVASLNVSKSSYPNVNTAIFNANVTKQDQSTGLTSQISCAADNMRGVAPLKQITDMESQPGFRCLTTDVEKEISMGAVHMQNGMPNAVKTLVHDHLRDTPKGEQTLTLENNLEFRISATVCEENADMLLQVDDVGVVPKSPEFCQDAKIIQQICDLLESKGWATSTEAFLKKHFNLQLSHSVAAKIILKQKAALAKPFFEWVCRQFGYDAYTCHALLLKLGQNKLFDEMWDLLNKMRNGWCQISETTFCIMVKAYGAANMPDMAVDVLKRCTDYQVTADARVFSTLLSVLFKLGLVGDAKLCYNRVVVEGVTLDVPTYSTLIRGFGTRGYLRDAQACLDAMLIEGLEPDVSTFNSLIEGFCCSNALQKALSAFLGLQKKGLTPSVYTFNILIQAFCKAGNLNEAIKLYGSMVGVCLPNQFTFNILLQGLLAKNDICRAISFFKLMESKGWVDARSYVFLSNGLRQVEQTEEMLELLRSLFEAHRVANVEVCNTLIYNLSHMDKLEEAEKIFKEMVAASETPSVPTYAIMISAYCRAGQLTEAMELHRGLKAGGGRPSSFCYIPITCLMLKQERVAEALKWVEEMLELDLEITVVTWDLLLKQLCRQGMVGEVMKISDLILEKRVTICVDTLFRLMKCLCTLCNLEVANGCFRAMQKQHCLPQCKPILQALAVMDKVDPGYGEK